MMVGKKEETLAIRTQYRQQFLFVIAHQVRWTCIAPSVCEHQIRSRERALSSLETHVYIRFDYIFT